MSPIGRVGVGERRWAWTRGASSSVGHFAAWDRTGVSPDSPRLQGGQSLTRQGIWCWVNDGRRELLSEESCRPASEREGS